MPEIYISTDCETDGPIPGPNSMLSFASAAFTADKQLVGTFSALPAGTAWPGPAHLAPVLHAAGELLSCALCLGAPAAAGVLAADVAVALALRAGPPGLHAAAQPARAALGLAAVAIAGSAVGGRLMSLVALSASSIGAAAGAR